MIKETGTETGNYERINKCVSEQVHSKLICSL
jgi:hypothetical protein